MIRFNFSLTLLLMPFIASQLIGCSKSDLQTNQVNVGEKETTISSNSSKPIPTNQITPSDNPSQTPVVYDVICFQAIGLAVGGTMCGNEETYKVPRGAKITVSAKTSTSVQGGSQTNTSYQSDKTTEKISIEEMESLATQGANVYVMYYHIDVGVLSNPTPSVEVEIYNSNDGKFKMFDKDPSQVTFITGDTKVRVEKMPVMGGLEYRYKKISDTNNIPSPKSTPISSCPTGKKTFVTAETTNFLLYICGQSNPTDYVGVSKINKKSIFLPLKSGNQFIAKNGDYTYTITRQFLTVKQNDKIIKKEQIISYQ